MLFEIFFYMFLIKKEYKEIMEQFSQNYETTLIMLKSLLVKDPINLHDYKNNARIIEQMIMYARNNGDIKKETELNKDFNEIKNIIKKWQN